MEIKSLVRDALRVFQRNPGFAAVIVVTLGLGIGMNSAIFSLINGVLLQPLPYAHGGELVRVRQGPLDPEGNPGNLSPLELVDVRERSQTLDRVLEYHTMFFNLLEEDQEPERVQVGVVSWDFFQGIGVPPIHGRTFTADEDRIDAEPVLVLGWDYWMRRFGGDPGVVGRSVEMNNRSHRIVGVLPPVPTYPNQNDVWMPWYACPFRVQDGWHLNRQARNLLTVARLAPGATQTMAEADMRRIASDLHLEFGDAYGATDRVGASLVPLKEELTQGARTTFLVLLGMSGLVLLIACANVANLTLARMNSRQHELAIKSALGASQGRILRQLLAESLALSLAGALVAIGVAYGSVGLLSDWASTVSPRANEIGVDGWVLAFTALVAVATGVLVGGLPGLYARRVAASLREDKGSGSVGRQRVRSALVVAQVTVAFVLLAGAGLMIRSFQKLIQVDPGYSAEDVLAVTVDLDWARYATAEDSRQFFDGLVDRVRQRPQVVAAAVASDFPMSGATFQTQRRLLIDSQGSEDASQAPQVNTRFITAGYFETLRIPVKAGRVFTREDGPDSTPVAVLSQAAAERLFDGGEAVGRRVSPDGGDTWATVIGVAGDVRQQGPEAELTEEVYFPYSQGGFARRLLVLTNGNAGGLARSITEDVYAIDPNQPVSFIQTLVEAEADRVASPRTIMTLLGIFALVALVTAAAGILSVIAYSTGQRRREIGIRLALGGERRDVVLMVLRGGLAMTGLGLGLGIALAVLSGGFMEGLLFGVAPTDPVTLGSAALTLLAVAIVATLVPAWRGTGVNPTEAFRGE